jgi:DNA-binding FrmR family transcriptional regulator
MKSDCCKHIYPDHSVELKRLSRIQGQIEGVRKMIEERRYCPEILTQLRAVRAALAALEANVLESHLQSCVTDAFASGNEKEREQKIRELKEIFRRFE